MLRAVARCCGHWPPGAAAADGMLWQTELRPHAAGEFSMAAAQANLAMEDQAQVLASPAATLVGVYDGHGGGAGSSPMSNEQGGMSTEVIRRAFGAAEEEFLQQVRQAWRQRPKMAAVGSCCLLGAISGDTLYVANLGDSRAVLGRRVVGGGVAVAERLTDEHNAASEEVRRELTALNPDDAQIVVHARGAWRVKGIIQVSRTIGDVYLKKQEYSMDPVFHGLWEHLSDDAAVQIVFKNPRTGIANRLVKAALKEATRKREVSFRDLKTIEKGVRRHFHDDISVIVVYLDRHRGRRHTRVVDSSSNCTNAPVDIYSSNSGQSVETLQAHRGSGW
uniref:protein-serine/threonine phosphatase n=1 Tax=Oryza rufipogon TaxID=4529 RepID=A0A0E0P1M6_ORYRU